MTYRVDPHSSVLVPCYLLVWPTFLQDAEKSCQPVLFIRSVWVNQLNETDKINKRDQINQTNRACPRRAGYRSSSMPKWFSAACWRDVSFLGCCNHSVSRHSLPFTSAHISCTIRCSNIYHDALSRRPWRNFISASFKVFGRGLRASNW